MINHHLDKLLRTRKIFRAGFVLLPLAGFLYVSHMNDVLSPDENVPDELTVVALTNARTSATETLQPGALGAGAPRMSNQPSDVADEALADSSIAEPIISASAEIDNSVIKTDTYVVNEGGSLWRTGRRFIDDEVLLDKLIDSLSESGMNVRSVSAGVGFVVNDLGSKGMLVVIEDEGDTYESRIVRNNVTSFVR